MTFLQHLFSSAKANVRYSTHNANVYIITVLHSEEAQGLVFHKGLVNMGPVFSKVWTWVWFGRAEGA